jgi:hypothetical protein
VEKRDVLRKELSALTPEELRFLVTRQLRCVGVGVGVGGGGGGCLWVTYRANVVGGGRQPCRLCLCYLCTCLCCSSLPCAPAPRQAGG